MSVWGPLDDRFGRAQSRWKLLARDVGGIRGIIALEIPDIDQLSRVGQAAVRALSLSHLGSLV